MIPWRRPWQPTPVFLPGESQQTEEPGGQQSMGLQRVRHDWGDLASMHMVTQETAYRYVQRGGCRGHNMTYKRWNTRSNLNVHQEGNVWLDHSVATLWNTVQSLKNNVSLYVLTRDSCEGMFWGRKKHSILSQFIANQSKTCICQIESYWKAGV